MKALTAGLIRQFVLVVVLLAHEQRGLPWRALRDARWLRAPSGSTGRRGGRKWW
ncbi:MAG TPA: hypothetical protein VJT49_02475 [Amycolatopsis sp.]|uniref:hypothetical protein n=1 Tax=Amycolatopsis sp. TaxID=37632 RepID=UPI002B480B76|nr:hypothetical protein [Amycolatopsis sp.]HKS43978.1 hypothetical protein [Amycolatopsis sp.]